jgi:cytochrome c553
MKTKLLTKRRVGWSRLLAAAAGLSLPLVVLAQEQAAVVKPDPKRGQEIASTICAACHGADGNSVLPANPKLTGQDPVYLVKQLNDYAKPADAKDARVNSIMAGMVASISVPDRQHVAAYFASQPHKPGEARQRDLLDLGQRIYRAGIPAKGVPACSGCHSPNGAGVPVEYPRLGGQHAEYVETQLKAFRDGTRRNSVPMMQIAPRMSDKEMAAVADYVSGLR